MYLEKIREADGCEVGHDYLSGPFEDLMSAWFASTIGLGHKN